MKSPALDEQDIAPTTNLSGASRPKREFWLVIVGLTALYLVVISIGNRRYVWFDELFTFDIARSASLHELWDRVLRFDCNPPTVHVLSRISMSIFGATPFGLRFPSMVEFYFGSVAVLLYVRRKVGMAFAPVAVLMLWAIAPTLYYAVEARPYALLFSSFAWLLLSWDSAIHARPRGWALFGISISVLALAGAHVFAPFTLFAFVVAEAVRFRRRRAPDYPLWAALLLPMLAVVIYIPLIYIPLTRLYGGIVFSDHASFYTLVLLFENTFGAPIMAFVLLVLLIPLPQRPEEKRPRFLAEEIALFACMSLSPIFLVFILMHGRGRFFDRYCVTSQAAILIAGTILLAKRVRLNRLAGYAASGVLILAILKAQVWHPLRFPAPQGTGILAPIQPDLPIVVADGLVFTEMSQRENQSILARLYYLKDLQASLQYGHTNYFQDFEAPDAMQKAGFPLATNIAPFAGFVRQNRRFLLLGNPADWVFLKLRASGASLAFAGDYSEALPYKDGTLYLVTMPSGSA